VESDSDGRSFRVDGSGAKLNGSERGGEAGKDKNDEESKGKEDPAGTGGAVGVGNKKAQLKKHRINLLKEY